MTSHDSFDCCHKRLLQSVSRREFLRQAGVFSLGLIAFGMNGWFARSFSATSSRRLVVVFLRGAVDGLNVVIPYRDPVYQAARPRIAIPAPGSSGGALDLDGRFGLHPALSGIMPYWQQGSMAFIHASGSPDITRSHFDAQDYMENGTPGRKSTGDGWMNRLLGVLPSQESPTQAVSFSTVMPKIMKGRHSVANIGVVGRRKNGGIQELPLDKPNISAYFDRMYAGNDAISAAYREGLAARRSLLESLNAEMNEADQGAAPAFGFADSTRKLARAMKNDPTIQLVFTDVGGWDTHVNQGASQGQLANKLKQLGNGIDILLKELGSIYPDTTVVVMSEFGRTVKENGNVGTDHGHGNVMWVAGGAIRGGRVYGDWPGLATQNLFEGRDLAVTTDFRSVLSCLLASRMGLSQNQLQHVFPGFYPAYGNLQGLVRG